MIVISTTVQKFGVSYKCPYFFLLSMKIALNESELQSRHC